MNDEEEVVVPSEEQSGTQEAEQSASRRRTLSERAEQVRDDINTVGKTVENFGKGEEKVADWMDGGSKVTNAASEVGSATSSAADAGSKAMKASGKATEAAGKATEAAGKATEAVGKATEAAGEGIKAGGKGVEAAGQGVSAAGSTPYTAALKPVGEAMKAGGKGTQAAGEGVKAGGKAEQAAGKAEQAAGKAEQAAGKAQQASADAAGAAAKGGKAASEAAKKANKTNESLSDKIRKNGKLNQARGKRLQDLSEKFDADKYMDRVTEKLGNLGKVLKGVLKLFDPKVIAVISLLIITLGTLLVSYVLSPMFFMNIVKKSLVNADNVENFNNYISGLGFKDSETAFYDEVTYLKTQHNDELDFSYIMSALYYTDIYYSDSSNYTEDGTTLCKSFNMEEKVGKEQCANIEIGYRLAKGWLQDYIKEATTTTGQDGLVYSSSKLYRLRDLAKHQFKGKTLVEDVPLKDYLELKSKQIQNELKNVGDLLPLLIPYALLHLDPGLGTLVDTILKIEDFTKLVNLLDGTETWKSIMMCDSKTQIMEDLSNLLRAAYGSIFNIKDVKISLDFGDVIGICLSGANPLVIGSKLINNIKVDYYEDAFNIEAFEDYLVTDYIPNMPEFNRILIGKNGKRLEGKELEDKAINIVYEMRTLKQMFDSIYQTDESAQKYGDCIGNIDLDLLRELNAPVDLKVGQTVTFSREDNYGLVKGKLHNGVDLNEASVGVKEGANVYSLYDGKVAKSTVDGTYDDKNVTGGWVAIDYTIQFSDSSANESLVSKRFKNKMSSIRVYYGGLNTSDLTLKSGDIVSKGQVIGHIGNASQSEDGTNPSLHFGIFDHKTHMFLNPVNMFITCEAASTASGLAVHTTSISKSNFIAATKNLADSSSCSSTCKKVLNSWDLSHVYDYSLQNKVNPELVVIRAIVEGFSPGGSSYNYWGINCTCKTCCSHYTSLDEGITKFANTYSVKNAETIEEMMTTYASFDYWYNPGNSADGGCYYYKYMKKYMTPSRQSVVESYCNSSKKSQKVGSSGCSGDCISAKEDMPAYGSYQSEKMNGLFENFYKSYH